MGGRQRGSSAALARFALSKFGEPGLTEFLENNLDVIAHIQVAGVPGRNEPDQLGEVNWRYMFDLLDSHGYPGWVGAEYVPRGDTLSGLGWAKDWGIGKRA